MSISTTRKYRERAKRTALFEIRNAANGVKPWCEYGSGLDKYDFSFRDVLNVSLLDFFDEIKKRRGSVIAMDFMGDGQVLRELKPDAGLALTLCDHRGEEKVAFDDSNNLSLLEGEILSPKTYQRMREWLESQDKNGFDLILARPVGGLEASLPLDPNYHYRILNELYCLLNDEGVLLVELYFSFINKPGIAPEADHTFNSWSKKMQRENNLDFSFQKATSDDCLFIFKIAKLEGAPEELPKLEF